ncbi:MAG: hypothetical protein GY925_17775 [Actinomycetia bacterium]|nr:hypothetical protein [Actinomycetes bacterium]
MKMLRMIDRATRSFGTVLALIVGIYLIAQTFASSTGATLGISMLLIVGSAITLRGAGLSPTVVSAVTGAGSVGLVLAAAARLYDAPVLGQPLQMTILAITVAMPVVILRFVLSSTRIDNNTVFAAVCVYLLIGVLFGTVFTYIAEIDGTVFEPAQAIDNNRTSSLYYYSFVTLTTVGFGDITPVGGAVRGLTVLEGLMGQIFIVVLVARLVGIQVAQQQR